MDIHEDEVICNANVLCAAGFVCLERGNPEFGMFNADNIFYASLMVIEIITLEGWSSYMYTVRKSQDGEVFYDFYFICVAMIGAFFVLNLMTAV
jgi:hypothetical protein